MSRVEKDEFKRKYRALRNSEKDQGTVVKAGWQTMALEEICEIERGGSPRPIDSFLTDAPDGINWIKIGDTKNVTKYITKTEEKIRPEGVKRSRMVYEGDFILSNSMSFGRPYIMKTTGCIHDGWLVLRQPKVDQDYLYHVLSSDLVFSQFDRLAAGSTVRNLNIGLVKGVQIPVPPLPEQQRIVGILDKAFEGIATAKANAEKNLQNARALFESHLQFVFTQRGDGWVEKRLGEVCEIIMGQSPDGETYNTTGEGMPLVNGPVEFSPDPFGRTVRSKFTTKPTKLCKKDDLILCVRGSTTGRINIAGFDACIGRGVAAIRAKEYQPWINHFINAKRDDIYCLGTGATFPNVSGAILGGLLLFTPSLAFQMEIVAKLDTLREETQRLARLYQHKLAALEELKKSLLHQAFSGQL